MIRIPMMLAGAIVIARAVRIVSEMHAGSYGGRWRWWLFALGYALLGAMTASAVVDALSGRGTLDQLGFVTASGLLIIGERRRHRRNCDAEHCPKSGRKKAERGTT